MLKALKFVIAVKPSHSLANIFPSFAVVGWVVAIPIPANLRCRKKGRSCFKLRLVLMFANVRRRRVSLKVQYSFASNSLQTLTHHLSRSHSSSPDSSTSFSMSSSALSSDYLAQFVPSCNTSSKLNSLSFVNPSEQRKVTVALSKMIKQEHGYLLRGFSRKFCPFFLVKILKLLGTREAAFTFFKISFSDDSDEIVKSSCISAHILGAERLRLLAQDLISWVISRIGAYRSSDLVEFMWKTHSEYETDFSVLDTLFRAFLNLEMGIAAMKILSKMREVGVRPSLSAISNLFTLLLRIGDYGSVWKLFRDLIRKGPPPTNYTFNVMILGFCRKGLINIGASLFHIMIKFHRHPDVITYNILINAKCINGQISIGFNLLRLMIARGCSPNEITISTIINALCKEGNMVDARKLLDEIYEMGISSNTAIYNALINGYVKARDVSQASRVYEEMRNKNIFPDVITFNTLVGGHFKYGREGDVDNLLKDLSRLIDDSSLCDVSVSGLCWAGRLDDASKFLADTLEKGIPITIVAFNSVISAYSSSGLFEKAFETYRMMAKFGFSPSSSTCRSLILGLSRKGSVEEARILLHKMIQKGFPIDKVAFTVLLDAYFRRGDLIEAQKLWNEMKELGIFPDSVAFAALINGLARAGLLDEAMDVFLEMLKNQFVPNNFVYNSLIGGLCKFGKLNEALKMEKQMMEKGLLPDIFTKNLIINALCKRGRMKSAIDTFMGMYRVGLTPDTVTYNTLIDGYCKALDMVAADEFIDKLSAIGWSPDVTSYNIRIRGFCDIRKVNQAMKLLDELILNGVVLDSVTYNTLMNGICNDVLDRAMMLAAKLLKMAFVPNVVTVNVLLSQFCKQGMPERALLWGRKFSQIPIDLDRTTYEIMDYARKIMGEDHTKFRSIRSGRSVFLDSLMKITYDYFCRTRTPKEDILSRLEQIVNSFSMNAEGWHGG